jgi:hypothetical protein
MQKLVIASLLTIVPALKSPTDDYTVLHRIIIGGKAQILVVKSTAGEELVIKCGQTNQVDKLKTEFQRMEILGKSNWSLKPVEFFMNQDAPCIVMEQLGGDVQRVRRASTEKWSIPTVVSIGIGIIDALTEMHFKYNLVHSDMHPGNIGYRKGDTSHLVVFDYGDMKPVSSPMSGKSDLKDALLSMRYYIDGDRKYYVAKQYSYNQAELCAGIPDELCAAIDLVFANKGKAVPKETYDEIRNMLTGLLKKLGVEYAGKIIWEGAASPLAPQLSPIGDKSKKVVKKPKTVAAKAAAGGAEKAEVVDATTTTITTTTKAAAFIPTTITLALVVLLASF